MKKGHGLNDLHNGSVALKEISGDVFLKGDSTKVYNQPGL